MDNLIEHCELLVKNPKKYSTSVGPKGFKLKVPLNGSGYYFDNQEEWRVN